MSTRRSFDAPGLAHRNPIPSGSIIGNLLMTSGIFGLTPGARTTPDGIEAQCRLMFENIRRVMEAAGGSPDDIIKLTVWIKDDVSKDALNQEWRAMFPHAHSRPARHTFLYDKFPGNTLVQCDVVAVLGG